MKEDVKCPPGFLFEKVSLYMCSVIMVFSWGFYFRSPPCFFSELFEKKKGTFKTIGFFVRLTKHVL